MTTDRETPPLTDAEIEDLRDSLQDTRERWIALRKLIAEHAAQRDRVSDLLRGAREDVQRIAGLERDLAQMYEQVNVGRTAEWHLTKALAQAKADAEQALDAVHATGAAQYQPDRGLPPGVVARIDGYAAEAAKGAADREP